MRVNGVQIQKPYSALNEANLALQCGARSNNEVLFRYTNKSASYAADDLSTCECSPTIQTQTLACPENKSGSINGSFPTSSCSTRQWTSWVTASNTCSTNAQPIPPVSMSAPGTACIPTTEQGVANCPSGQIGFVIETRTKKCLSEQWGSWITATQSSAAPAPASTPCAYDSRTDKETAQPPVKRAKGGPSPKNLTAVATRKVGATGKP